MIDHDNRVREMANLLRRLDSPLFVGYSGGKDSSSVLSILWQCLESHNLRHIPVTAVYCDTQVENPVVDAHAKSTLAKLEDEARSAKIPFTTRIVQPRVDQSFFVRIIGRGYPTPTHSFRWCTKDIRIRPMRHFVNGRNAHSWIAIGTRWGESQQRDRALRKFVSTKPEERFIQRQQEGFPNASLITPIIDYETADVWELLCTGKGPVGINPFGLAKIYKDGGGECPTLRDFKDKPCSKSRFGCWTCTVVRKDKSAANLIDSGHEELVPFFRFRDWLIAMRNNPLMRCKRRRNGSNGLGPFTIEARLSILANLDLLEESTGQVILSAEQRELIGTLIQNDRESSEYAALEQL